jgi:hypothetical protein
MARMCDVEGCDKAHRAKGLCATHYNQQAKAEGKLSYTVAEVACTTCGEPTLKRVDPRRKVRFCSYECRDDHRALLALDAMVTLPAPERATQARSGEERREWWWGRSCRIFARDCQVCSQPFTSRFTIATCSAACAETKRLDDKREAKHRHRARKRSAFVAPVVRREVYERDGWRCQLCGRAVKRDADVPHPMAPTLDHIIPLAAGGTHEPTNVQTAHFLCNATKGARGGGQLRLIA